MCACVRACARALRAYVWGRRLDRGNYVGPRRLISLDPAAVVGEGAQQNVLIHSGNNNLM